MIDKSQNLLVENQRSISAIEKLILIETKKAKKKGFLWGLIFGILFIIFVVSGISFYAWSNLDKISNKFLPLVASNYMENVFKAFPEAYVSQNREKVMKILDDFTNAVAGGKISKKEFNSISKSIIAALKDRKFRYREVDQILEMMESAAKD